MTIKEVCSKYDLSADTLRYYEKIGLIPPVKRTQGGIRNYDEDSCRWIDLMKCLRLSGVQIDALVEYVKLFKEGDSTLIARKNILVEQHGILVVKLNEIQKSIDRIEYKLDNYDKLINDMKLMKSN